MELRPELQPPLVDEDRLTLLTQRIEAIADLLDRGSAAEVEAAIREFNELTGSSYEPYDFRYYAASRSARDFALEAARPVGRVPDIAREELIEIVRRIQDVDPEVDYYVDLFEANILDPRGSGLIYWPPEELEDATPEEIVDVALSYRPIEL